MIRDYEAQLIDIIERQDWLMTALRSVRDLHLLDWYIAAGAIRNTVWNYLHKFQTTFHQKDIDVVYFDASDMNGEKERTSEALLKLKSPNLTWEVVNQARAHLFKCGPNVSRPPVHSSCESIAYWSETPTCVGVRLEPDDNLTICAPHGLCNLMNLVVRPTPEPYQDLQLYRERLQEKKWDKFWSRLKIIFP